MFVLTLGSLDRWRPQSLTFVAVSGVCKYDTITLVPRVSTRVLDSPGHVSTRAWRVMSQRERRVYKIARVVQRGNRAHTGGDQPRLIPSCWQSDIKKEKISWCFVIFIICMMMTLPIYEFSFWLLCIHVKVCGGNMWNEVDKNNRMYNDMRFLNWHQHLVLWARSHVPCLLNSIKHQFFPRRQHQARGWTDAHWLLSIFSRSRHCSDIIVAIVTGNANYVSHHLIPS